MTVSARFTFCLGNYVNEKSCFDDFLTEQSYVKSVQHWWRLPKFILRCNCSSEAFTVLSKCFHKVTSITTCSPLYHACPFPCRKGILPSPPAQAAVGSAGSLIHGRTCSKERTKRIIWKQNALRELSLQRGFVWVSFLFPFTCVHVCVYIW